VSNDDGCIVTILAWIITGVIFILAIIGAVYICTHLTIGWI